MTTTPSLCYNRRMMKAMRVDKLPHNPHEDDFHNRELVLNHALLNTPECRANHIKALLLKDQILHGMAPTTLVLKDE